MIATAAGCAVEAGLRRALLSEIKPVPGDQVIYFRGMNGLLDGIKSLASDDGSKGGA